MLLHLGELYVIGGQERFPLSSNKVDVVTLETGAIASAPSMLEYRGAPAVTSSVSSIFVFGGRRGSNDLSTCEIFNTQSAQ